MEPQTFVPVGTRIQMYDLKPPVNMYIESVRRTPEPSYEDEVIIYEIYKGIPAVESDVKAYHSNLELFVYWFIDASSFIDQDDDHWTVYFMYALSKKHD